MAQQTAVEWLWNELCDKGYFKRLPISEIKQAKQMEKEQIIKTHLDCWGTNQMSAEQYYNKTYKKQ